MSHIISKFQLGSCLSLSLETYHVLRREIGAVLEHHLDNVVVAIGARPVQRRAVALGVRERHVGLALEQQTDELAALARPAGTKQRRLAFVVHKIDVDLGVEQHASSDELASYSRSVERSGAVLSSISTIRPRAPLTIIIGIAGQYAHGQGR